jgi:hypothetical protein
MTKKRIAGPATRVRGAVLQGISVRGDDAWQSRRHSWFVLCAQRASGGVHGSVDPFWAVCLP